MEHERKAEVQHYVPKFLLRNFGTGKKDRVHVFDKQDGKIFATNVKNVAAESRFYDFQFEGKDLTLETYLSKLEGVAKPIIQSILNANSLENLNPKDRGTLSFFVAVQLLRSKWHREQFRLLPQLLQAELRLREGEGADLEGIADYFQVPDANELAIHTAHSVLSTAKEFAPHFSEKIWMLLVADLKGPFLLGDNPIVMHNSIDMGLYGNRGLAVRGIEIYFPLSPRLVLAMLCPSHRENFLQGAERKGGMPDARKILAAIDFGVPPFLPEAKKTAFLNSLQIGHAERFVISSNGDFSLVRKMIESDARFRGGPRSEVN